MKSLLKELREFLFRGNIVDLAVAVVVGGAFSAIVNSLVKDVITPIIGLLFGSTDFSAITWGTIKIGSFINSVISFVLIGTTLFFVLKAYNTLLAKVKKAENDAQEEAAPSGPSQEQLLAEIRDLLKLK